MDWIGDILELLKFEIDHDDIILEWAIMDLEQNLTIKYLDE